MALNTTAEIINDINQGKMVILMDDEDRENEGDLIIAAEAVSAETINFFSSEACGLICLTITADQAKKLELPLMVRDNHSQHETNFTVSIDAAIRQGPGISSAQRSATVAAAVSRNASPADIIQPGHIFPIVAKEGGVLRRAGHTEAGTDLARLAGFSPASLIVEIMNEDGTMARRPELEKFGEKHGLKIGTIADLIAYRSLHEKTIELKDRKAVETQYGQFILHTYIDLIDEIVHYALIRGDIGQSDNVIARVQTLNTLRDIFGTQRPGEAASWSVGDSLSRIAEEGKGVLVLIGRKTSIESELKVAVNFPNILPPSESGQDGTQIYRLIGSGSQILKDLGITKMRALGKPTRFNAISGFNLEITEFIEK